MFGYLHVSDTPAPAKKSSGTSEKNGIAVPWYVIVLLVFIELLGIAVFPWHYLDPEDEKASGGV